MLDALVLQNRSYRAFDERKPMPLETVLDCIDLARRTASGMNLQPLRYRVLVDPADIDLMLANCRFAGKLSVSLPPEGGKPTAFVLIFTDSEVQSPASLYLKDVGIAAQTLLLAATEKGFGGCMIGGFQAERLNCDFGIPSRFVPQLALALGKPQERVMLTDLREGDTSYYRDAGNVHYVPKRSLEEILI